MNHGGDMMDTNDCPQTPSPNLPSYTNLAGDSDHHEQDQPERHKHVETKDTKEPQTQVIDDESSTTALNGEEEEEEIGTF